MSQIDPRILSQLAHFDGQVHQHRSAIASGKTREAMLEQQRREYAGEAQEKKTRLSELEETNKVLQKEIEELQRQIKQHSGRLHDVQDNREYTALNDEVRYLRRQIENKEETILTNMELVEKSQAQWDSASSELEAKAAEIKAELERIRAERLQSAQAMEQAKKDLELYLDKLDVRTVTWYQRRAQRQDQPVVWMNKDACGACHARLTPQMQLEVKNGTSLVTCQSCGRIVVASLEQINSSVS